jgi:hypothetical protein
LEEEIMKPSERFQNLVIAALALFGFISMPWAPAANAADTVLGPQPTPYQQFGATSNCGAGGACYVIFPAVTANTLISQVTCTISLVNTSGINAAGLGNGQGGNMYFPTILQNQRANPNTSYYLINAEVQMFFLSGQQPVAFVLFDFGAGVATCSVFGYTTPGVGPAPTPASASPPDLPSSAYYRRVPLQ